jgi:hypothetical protein
MIGRASSLARPLLASRLNRSETRTMDDRNSSNSSEKPVVLSSMCFL